MFVWCACRFGALRQWQLQEAGLSITIPPLYGLLRYRRLEDAVAAYNALNKRVRSEPCSCVGQLGTRVCLGGL